MNDEAPPGVPTAGWYPDPADPSLQRYWDGSNWTEHSAPRPPPGQPERRSNLLLIAGYACALLLPIVGLAIGVALLVRRETGHGVAIVLLSIAIGVGSYLYVVNDEADAASGGAPAAATHRPPLPL